MTQSFPLKFTDQHKQSNADHSRDIVSDFSTGHMCLTGSITMQCGLSAGKQKLTVILPRELGAFANSVYTRLSFFLPHTRAWE